MNFFSILRLIAFLGLPNSGVVLCNGIPYGTAVQGIFKLGWWLLNQGYFGPEKVSLNDMISDVSLKIDNIEKSLKMSERTIISEVNKLINYHQTMHDFTQNLNYINNLYDQFQRYSTNTSYQNSTLENFAEDNTSHGINQLPNILNSIYRLIKPNVLSHTGLFDLLIENRRTKDDAAKVCNTTVSLQQQVYELYNIASVVVVKGYVMIFFSYGILKNFGRGDYANEITATKENYKHVMSDIGRAAITTMNIASRYIRPCDPQNHKEGATYVQLTWFLGAMLANEVQLNPSSSCWKTCPDYKTAEFYPRSGVPSSKRNSCQGTLHDCFSQALIHYCEPTRPYRRFDGFKAVTVLLGTSQPNRGYVNCKDGYGEYDIKLWSRVRHGMFDTCDVCICYCDDYNHPDTVRTFSLKPVQSNINDNMVITGIRFVQKQRVIHIQIQEGKLQPDGKISKSTVRWVPVEEFGYKNDTIAKNDYFTLTYYQRSINLDTLWAPKNQLLTGIKFSTKESHLNLEIKVSPFNYTAGTVDSLSEHWISNPTSERYEIEVKNPHIPTLGPVENIVDTRDNLYIKFGTSDWVKDISQTPVPFIDTQSVISDPPLPLSGAGVFYKRQTGYGGFVGLQLVAYNYTEFITTDVITN